MKDIHFNIKAISGIASAFCLASCNWLDVSPEKVASFDDAMKNKQTTENWIYSCYGPIAETSPITYRTGSADGGIEYSTDEFVLPQTYGVGAQTLSYDQVTSSSEVSNFYWTRIYGAIGHINLFLRELDRHSPLGVTDDDRALYKAHTNFLKAYYYSLGLKLFGPVPIVNEYIDANTPAEEFPGRYHYDYVVNEIIRLLDEAETVLPPGYALDETWGRANDTVCEALKARVLLYAASDLWNGSFPYPTWSNTGFETPGYGKELVSHEFDITKWERAYDANRKALETAIANGRRLLTIEDARKFMEDQQISAEDIFIPGVDPTTPEGKEFIERTMLMRYVVCSDETMGNYEYVWGSTSAGYAAEYAAMCGLPRNLVMLNSGTEYSGWSALSPTLNIVESFYTRNGRLPADDPDFIGESAWLERAGIEGHENIINLNTGREPRFYAWITFDDCELGPFMRDGEPLNVNFLSKDAQGYSSAVPRDNCQTGYLSNKYTAPAVRMTPNTPSALEDSGHPLAVNRYPEPFIRLAELYLNIAECCAELYLHKGDAAMLTEAIENLNVIRKRAGIPELDESDCTAEMTILDWVRAERTVELFGEGHRFYDLRRWMIAPEKLATGIRKGLDSFESKIENPTFEQFNREVTVNQPFSWSNRMYMLPISMHEVYSDPQLVQAPGY